MTILFEEEEARALPFDYKELTRKTVTACLDYVDCPYETECSLLLTNDEVIHSINMEQRQIDRPTDVLSFPFIEWTEIEDFDALETHGELFQPDTGELMLGDIVLSLDRVYEQAKEYGHSIEREFSFLIAHSILHLFGYDHMKEGERIVMEEAQNCIMQKIGIAR